MLRFPLAFPLSALLALSVAALLLGWRWLFDDAPGWTLPTSLLLILLALAAQVPGLLPYRPSFLLRRRRLLDLTRQAPGQPYALLLLRIDPGDPLLRRHGIALRHALARAVDHCLHQQLRSHDVIGMVDGATTAIVLRQANAAILQQAARRLQGALEDLSLPAPHANVMPTMAILGVLPGPDARIDVVLQQALVQLRQLPPPVEGDIALVLPPLEAAAA